jgi:hypothetical protein
VNIARKNLGGFPKWESFRKIFSPQRARRGTKDVGGRGTLGWINPQRLDECYRDFSPISIDTTLADVGKAILFDNF